MEKKTVLLIQPAYPYGKKQVFLGNSLLIIAVQLMQVGFKVDIVDMNLEDPGDITHYDFIGITVTGAPYIPVVADYLSRFNHSESMPTILLGGQPIAHLENDLFESIFEKNVIQIKSDSDLVRVLGIEHVKLTSPFEVSLHEAFDLISDNQWKLYLKKEMTLFVSQGCHFHCAFCAAAKGMREQFRNIDLFKSDLTYLAKKAQTFGYKKLEFYATNLDFFQHPKKIVEYLKVIHSIKVEYGIDIRVRCLACMPSFLKAHAIIPNLKQICNDGGLWCIGFGVDGTDATVWKAQKKTQNNLEDVVTCLSVSKSYGIRAEILLVMGFPQDTYKSLWRNFTSACRLIYMYDHTVLRPYLAKEFVPGNDHWDSFPDKSLFIKNTKLFYNIDFCMAGSKFTHPHFGHRFVSNLVYLSICSIFTPINRCATYPLLPYSNSKIWNMFAKFWNYIMPFDK
jgi:hypothetical protein